MELSGKVAAWLLLSVALRHIQILHVPKLGFLTSPIMFADVPLP